MRGSKPGGEGARERGSGGAGDSALSPHDSRLTTHDPIYRTREAMAAQGLPALFITRIVNVGWISGFTGSSGYVLLTPERAIFATDSRYTEQAKAQCPAFEQVKLETGAPEEITGLLAGLDAPKIGFEAGHLTYQQHQTYREKLPAAIELTPTTGLIEDLRMVKDAEEIARIQAACGIVDRAFTYIQPYLRPGVSERDVMLELEWYIRRQERADIAFDTIVASGPRSALPHGRASERVMQAGDFVTLDFGARLEGYCSDITRTVVLGAPTDRQREVYGVVLEAMNRAIEGIRPGAEGRAVDALARDHIKAAGFGDYFGHGLGHSLGREVHDGPAFSLRSEVTLAVGMVATVEPGIYIPEWGGVRVEQDVLVTADGASLLTYSPTELLAL